MIKDKKLGMEMPNKQQIGMFIEQKFVIPNIIGNFKNPLVSREQLNIKR